MGRQNSVEERLPSEVRDELDNWLLKRIYSQVDCAARLQGMGYDISKSAVNRYAIKSHNGAEDLKLRMVAGQPLGQAVAEMVVDSDEDLALLLADLIALQIHQLAVLRKLQSRMKARQREADAASWATAQHPVEGMK